MPTSRVLLFFTALTTGALLCSCCGTSHSGNLVRTNGRYQDSNYVGTIELSDFILKAR